MKIALLTENRADWGAIKPVLHEAKSKHDIYLDVLWSANVKKSRLIKSFLRPDFTDESGQKIKIDWYIVQGDRAEVLRRTILAWKKGYGLAFGIAHLSGGDKQDGHLIDEPVRYAISKFAHLHFYAESVI